MECIARSQQLCCLDDEFLWSCSSSVFLLKIRSVRILDMTVPRLRRKCRAVELKLNSVVLDLKHRPGILGSAQSDRTSTDRQNHTPHPHPTAGHRRNRHGLAAVDSTPSSPPATAPTASAAPSMAGAAQRGCVHPVLRRTCWLRLAGNLPAGRSGCQLTARRSGSDKRYTDAALISCRKDRPCSPPPSRAHRTGACCRGLCRARNREVSEFVGAAFRVAFGVAFAVTSHGALVPRHDHSDRMARPVCKIYSI